MSQNKKDIIYVKQLVTNDSYEGLMEEGFDQGDNGRDENEYYAGLSEQAIKMLLTRRQLQVVICLQEGLTRKEIALRLIMSEQAVHQIIPRIRARLKKLGYVYGNNTNARARIGRSSSSQKSGMALPVL